MIMMNESVDIGATGDKISDLYKFTINVDRLQPLSFISFISGNVFLFNNN